MDAYLHVRQCSLDFLCAVDMYMYMCTFTFSLSHVIKVKRLKRQNEKLLERIQLLIQRNGVNVDDALQSDLLALVDEFDKQIKYNHTKGTFKRIFGSNRHKQQSSQTAAR